MLVSGKNEPNGAKGIVMLKDRKRDLRLISICCCLILTACGGKAGGGPISIGHGTDPTRSVDPPPPSSATMQQLMAAFNDELAKQGKSASSTARLVPSAGDE